jgi:hypothetical protein
MTAEGGRLSHRRNDPGLRRCGALGGTRTPNLLIRRVCHGSLLPGYMLPDLLGCLSLFRIVCQSFAVWYGQIQTIGGLMTPEAVGRHYA